MDKERLEDIKAWFKDGGEINQFQIEWLIKQAEKVEELQKNNSYLNKTIGEYAGRISNISDELNQMARHLFNA